MPLEVPGDGEFGVHLSRRPVREVLMRVAGHFDTVHRARGVHQLVAVVDVVVDAVLRRHVREDDVADGPPVYLPPVAGVIPVKAVGITFDPAAWIRQPHGLAVVDVLQRFVPVERRVLRVEVRRVDAKVFR